MPFKTGCLLIKVPRIYVIVELYVNYIIWQVFCIFFVQITISFMSGQTIEYRPVNLSLIQLVKQSMA